ncbi:Transcriptional regulator ADR1 [Fusarium oxysporum f. sp. albedinis]|nr:Transcriptional regulator ADR1 [Fusarium oxysporum f. sp. albedinis]
MYNAQTKEMVAKRRIHGSVSAFLYCPSATGCWPQQGSAHSYTEGSSIAAPRRLSWITSSVRVFQVE